jgi:hypothetical protein
LGGGAAQLQHQREQPLAFDVFGDTTELPIARRGADATADRVLDRLQLGAGHHIVHQESLHQFIDKGCEKMQFGSLRRLILAV